MSKDCSSDPNQVPDYKQFKLVLCKRSVAVEECPEPDKEEPKMKCFPESNEPEKEEDCQFGKIDKRRRNFVKSKKDEIIKMGDASLKKLIEKPKPPEEPVVDETAGAIHLFDTFQTPFSSNSTIDESIASGEDPSPSSPN